MALSSMTGFARSHGASGPYTFEWELKSVNAKGFDLRLRLPPGWDELEALGQEARRRTAVARHGLRQSQPSSAANAVSTVRINEDVLASIVKVAGTLAGKIDAVAPSIDGLLGIKGVIEVVEPESDEAEDKAAKAAAAGAFEQALDRSRRDAPARGRGARADPARSAWTRSSGWRRRRKPRPAASPRRSRRGSPSRSRRLLETSDRFDPDRLNQEAILIATKADIREELDRIASHIAQAREMIGKGGPVGRRLDFLAQEFNREVNTCCSKSNDIELTNTGLEMKNVVEQFREQVQNLE